MENEVYLNKSNYQNRKEYLERYHELSKSYEFKVRVDGGWLFFRYAPDYQMFKRTR